MPKSDNGVNKPIPRKKRSSARSAVPSPDTPPVPPQVTSFGSVLQKYRLEANISQTELAKIMNTSRNTITNWETDRSKPNYDEIRELCHILSIPVQELFSMYSEKGVSPQELTILHIFRKLSPVGQRTFSKLINQYLQEELEERNRYLQESFCALGVLATPIVAGANYAFQREYIFVKKTPKSTVADSVAYVSGTSMEPLYHDGDLVYIQSVNEDDDMNDGNDMNDGDVICSTTEGTVIKRIYNHKFYSLNKDFPYEESGENDQSQIIGRVLGTIAEYDMAADDDYPALEELLFRT